MSGLNIEGDLSQINERQFEYIKSVIEKRGYTSGKVTITPLGEAGDNYIAIVKRIAVEDGNGRIFKMVAKIAPGHEKLRQAANIEQLFRNEHIMYTKVLPKLTELEKAAEVPPQERLRYATCYGSFEEAPNEVILLEDLNDSGFVMLDRFKPLGQDCVKSILKNFAFLHSLSYALKYKEPQVYEEFKNTLFDMWTTIDTQERVVLYFKHVEKNASKIVDSDIHKKAVSGAITGSLKEFAKEARNNKDSKHSIIQQGDAWTNNIMFKFDGEALQESVMIDYQVSKAANPTADILYMIFNCTDFEMRKAHFYDWIDYYHIELDKALSNYGLKASFVYSKDQLDADIKRYSKINFGLSILLAGIISMKTEEASTMKAAMETSNEGDIMKTAEAVEKDPETVTLFKKRVEGIIDSYYDFGFM